jgi:predicted RNA-binding protein with EMAP domain
MLKFYLNNCNNTFKLTIPKRSINYMSMHMLISSKVFDKLVMKINTIIENLLNTKQISTDISEMHKQLDYLNQLAIGLQVLHYYSIRKN